MGKSGKILSAFFWALNRGLKLADDTKFVLDANNAEHCANISFFSTFWPKIDILSCRQQKKMQDFLSEKKIEK